MKKQTILCIQPDPNDATSFYRGMGPIGEMKRQSYNDFEFAPCPKGMTITWSVLAQADWLFMQRPFTEQHLQMIAMAKQNGLKVWCDWDDDILNIPRSNYTHRIYAARGARQNVSKIMELADFVTASTEHLAYILGSDHRTNVHVVPNAINTRLFPLETRQEWLKKQKGPLKKKRVFWRGGRTHVQDLMVFEEPMKQIINEHQDWEFAFCGDTDWPLLDALEGAKNAQIFEAKDVIEYHKSFKYYAAQVLWVPLMDNLFNQSKSMCAWLEGTYAGCAVIGPEFNEWKREGITNYASPDDFYKKMTGLLEDDELRLTKQAESVDTIINDGLTLKDTAKTRLELLKQYS